MKKLYLTLLLLVSFPLLASHIVGGEFELIHLSGSNYRLNLIIYFDQLNGNIGAKDPSARVYIYRKRDKQLMGSVLLTLNSESNVSYTQPSCSKGEIVTSKLIYTSTLVLAPDQYNDTAGYYVVWERCCRNYTITNIYSQVPQGTNISAGQTFYLEFPPVVKDGQPFVNSSPRLFPPLNDYACPFRPYYVDFAGIDDDGDSLVYTLTTPLNTTSNAALPPPSAGPYPTVIWRPGYSLTNVINGLPDLRISTDGLLTATPRTQGLFVFAVKVDEYRNKIKIGESRRDFQMLVVDNCPSAEAPRIEGKKLTNNTFSTTGNLSVSFDNTITDEDRCINVRITDPDASKISDNFTEKISIRAVGLNFPNKNLKEILPEVTSATLINGSSVDFKICFPRCPYFEGGPYQVGIIAQDDACSLPLSDTLRVTVNVQPPVNTDPYFTSSKLTIDQLQEGDNKSWAFQAKDNEGDELVVSILTDGFVLKDAGMTLEYSQVTPGLVNGVLKWDTFCDMYDFTKRTSFEVKIRIDDTDECDFGEPDYAVFKLNVNLPGNSDPIIDTDLTTNPSERFVPGVQRKINETLEFTVTGKDIVDNDFLTLSARGKDFALADYGISFPTVSGRGILQSKLKWDISCANVNPNKKDNFVLQFIVVDNSNKCRFYKADTVEVEVIISPPDNAKPMLQVEEAFGRSINDTIEFVLGQPIQFNFLGTDTDTQPAKDVLTLSLFEASGSVEPEGYIFEPREGRSPVQSFFSWNPDCSIFKDNTFTNTYRFAFRLGDDKCYNSKADSVVLHFKVLDGSVTTDNFLPPNVITPNGDGFNDYFAVEGIDPGPDDRNYDADINFPQDNCVNQFESVAIFNRWGNKVFGSTDRRFRWYAPNEAAGVYFYVFRFTNKEYKGSLSVRY